MRKFKKFRCEQCKIYFSRRKKVRRFCTLKCFYKFNRKEKHSRWKSDPNYSTSHAWIKKQYGCPNLCEGKNCTRESNKYDWALKHDKVPSRNRKDYFRLCRSCHMKYDFNEQKRRILSMRAKKQNRVGKFFST